ncbi:MAG: hypothetical protein D6707_07355 [Bacteroidetes bacterium]|nr:MAG: hypothetical protein D6707_07355 [Bacteroidota bacterium]
MTKRTEIDKKVKSFIINRMTDYEGKQVTDIDERIRRVKKAFEAEYGWRVEEVGIIQAISEWLQGLPSVITIPYKYQDIIELAVNIGSLPLNHTKKQAEKIINNYYNFMANKVYQLFEGYRIPKNPLQ